MYSIEREYKCGICGKKENGIHITPAVGFGYWELPFSWTGSMRKYGECYCKECSNNIKKLKENQS